MKSVKGNWKAGVGILIHKDLIDSGQLTLDGSPYKTGCGRLISLKVKWGGHHIQLASLYLPNDGASQRQFISEHLVGPSGLFNKGNGKVRMWGGDMNFVENPSLDRFKREGGVLIRPSPIHTNVGDFWKQHLPLLIDIYRLRHPTGRSMTRFDWRSIRDGGNTAARLDRMYVDSKLAASIPYANVLADSATIPGANSDHLLTIIDLLAVAPVISQPQQQEKRLFRVKLHFKDDTALVEQFRQFICDQWEVGKLQTEEEYIEWWPKRFKPLKVSKIKTLNQQHRLNQTQAAALNAQELQQLFNSIASSDVDTVQGLATADHLLQQYVTAHHDRAVTRNAQATEQQSAWRKHNIHAGETANPQLTAYIKPPAKNRITALKADSGRLETSPKGCAKLLTTQYADVSKYQPACPIAQQQVLETLRPTDSPGLEEFAEGLGSTTVTAAEVKVAVKKMKPGTAPGPDGIPINAYQLCKEVFSEMLAKLFSAIGKLGKVPKGFLNGIIIPLFKLGLLDDRSASVNYRPITLLLIEYRILAKVLGNRIAPLLHLIIDPGQSAFVPGRNMGDNIRLLQMMGPALRRMSHTKLCVLCDIKKAYDTVNRNFLYAVMEKLGVGAGFIGWVKLLLSDTKAAAVVNGHTASYRRFEAGVRQGCPLAPFLYLFVAEAATRFLRQRIDGVLIAGIRFTVTAHADDIRAYLNSLDEVEPFMDTMRLFGKASNQELSAPKSAILPVGTKPATELPMSVCNIPIVNAVKNLGIVFTAYSCEVQVDWPELLTKACKKNERLAACSMSAFGRGFCSSAYASSTFLFQAEFAGRPDKKILKKFITSTAKLVDRAGKKRFAGVKADFLAGHPRLGGFGVLPVIQHTQARDAKWGLALLFSDGSQPWVLLARYLISGTDYWNPLQILGGATVYTPVKALRDMLRAVQRLPKMTSRHLPIGPWVLAMPLFNNPLIPNLMLLEDQPHRFIRRTEVQTVMQANRALLEVTLLQQNYEALQDDSYETRQVYKKKYRSIAERYFGYVGCWSQTIPDPTTAIEILKQTLQQLPDGWSRAAGIMLSAATTGRLCIPTDNTKQAMILVGTSLCWPTNRGPMTWADYTVKWGTQHFMAPLQRQRRKRMEEYAELTGSAATDVEVEKMLGKLWAIKCKNKMKEIVWRLVLNGLPTAQRMRGNNTVPCGCGAVNAGRRHHYWLCPAAAHLRQHIRQQVMGIMGVAEFQLQQQHLWLTECPQGLHPGIWRLVVLAALNALSSAHKLGTKQRLKSQQQNSAMTSREEQKLQQSCIKTAIVVFWKHLGELAGGTLIPWGWRANIRAQHPFLKWDPVAQRLRINRYVPET